MMIRAAKEKPESGDQRAQEKHADHQPEPGLTRLNIGKDAELLQCPNALHQAAVPVRI